MNTRSPIRLALHSDLRERGDQALVYRDMVDLFAHADRLGFDSAWVRQYHFRGRRQGSSFDGGLPSPFVFLSAVAQRTENIRLGTGVVTLPLENPVRVAENAAVLDVLSNGRVELGVANGGHPAVARSLGMLRQGDTDQRKADYLRSLDILTGALAGEPLDPTDPEFRLNPSAPTLVDRMWEAALTEQSGHDIAARGNGVLIGSTQTVPAEVTARAYHSSAAPGGTARVGLVVHVHPAATRELALAEIAEEVEATYAWGRDWLPHANTLQEKAAGANVHYGSAADIVESIRSFPAFAYVTDLQVAVHFGTASHAHRVDVIDEIVESIAPHLGWAPALSGGEDQAQPRSTYGVFQD
ncbi:alkanesulfonate monooxygenase SsuD/methylene tetrahydromethanopterin reductase-like flavin-dependent oxidoreductase (luciferase family) [Rhodococcus sp. 27YEA15]|uniref:LLM class flavin-dependent oxidoreductase n=1 Tax=Rhodococcus sp. 27YEA15 TaxID=3156259 RepID=UPI003C7C7617